MRIFRTQQQWLALLAQYDPSLHTQKTFCKAHKISLSSFHAQRKKLSIASQASKASGFIKAKIITHTPPVTTTAVSSEQVFTLWLSKGKVTLPSTTPASYLASLVEALL